jgi:hypothetical protein
MMASAITSGIKTGEIDSVKEYLERCAKMCGPLIHMRDDKLTAPIRKRSVSPYTKGRILQAEERLAEAKAMTLEEATRAVEKDYQYDLERRRDNKEEAEKLRKTYEDMLEKVKAWEIPTEDHKHVKEMAIDHLEMSIDFDCNWVERFDPPKKEDPQKYIDDRIKWAEDSLRRAKEDLAEEEDRVQWANDWIERLQLSLEDLDENIG